MLHSNKIRHDIWPYCNMYCFENVGRCVHDIAASASERIAQCQSRIVCFSNTIGLISHSMNDPIVGIGTCVNSLQGLNWAWDYLSIVKCNCSTSSYHLCYPYTNTVNKQTSFFISQVCWLLTPDRVLQVKRQSWMPTNWIPTISGQAINWDIMPQACLSLRQISTGSFDSSAPKQNGSWLVEPTKSQYLFYEAFDHSFNKLQAILTPMTKPMQTNVSLYKDQINAKQQDHSAYQPELWSPDNQF